MRENLVMTSACARPYAPTDWQGGAKADSTRERKESLRHSACVCLGETLTSLPKGSQWSFSSKDLAFLGLFALRQRPLKNIAFSLVTLLLWSRCNQSSLRLDKVLTGERVRKNFCCIAKFVYRQLTETSCTFKF